MNGATTIFAAALATEGLLVIVSYILTGLFTLHLAWNSSLANLVLGVCCALPLLVGNHLLWRWSLTAPDSVYARFSKQVVVPLCKQVRPPLALLLAVLSGFGEELLFRGALNQIAIANLGWQAAAFLTSLVFAYVHFIGNEKRFGGMIPLYTAVGLYLWGINHLTGSLFCAFVTHAAYNFLAIVWIRRTA
jgi:membrane protease YdiL (CAAX protease family)